MKIVGGFALLGGSPLSADILTGPSTSYEPFVIPAAGHEEIQIHSIVTAAKDARTFDGYFHTGSPDGTAAYDNGDGTFTILVNHEIPYIPSFTIPPQFESYISSFTNEQRELAHGGKGSHVAKWVVNKPDHATDPLKVISGEDLIQSVFVWDKGAGAYVASVEENFQVFCSSDMAPQSAFFDSTSGKGSQVKLYLTGEEFPPFDVAQTVADETGFLNRAQVVGQAPDLDIVRLDGGRAFAVEVDGPHAGTAREIPAFGNMNFENAVASPFEQEKTVVMLSDDENPGQVYLYVGLKNTTGALEIDKAGLTNGSLYGMSVNGQLNEAGVSSGDAVAFVDFGDVKSDDWDALEAMSDANAVTRFSKPEDIAWDPLNPNRFYFVTSGGTNPARLWRVTLGSIANPGNGGTIEILADEGLTPGAEFSGFDNIACDFKGDVFIQEDGSSSALNLSRVWRYDASAGTMTVIAHHNPRFFKNDGQSEFLSDEGETSGILDLSSVLGEGWYLLTSMAHAPASPDAPNKQLGKLEAYEFDPPYYEEGQLMLMFIPQEMGGSGQGLALGFDGGYFLTFQREAGFNYQVQRSSNLTPVSWQNIGVVINGAAGVQRVDVTPVNLTREFYRIKKSEVP
ncbi:alkaline phosphatase PhoX [Verrucomicrobiaceae bacterium 227]